MSKLRVAFYKARYGGFDDHVINRFSGNIGYSHCEVVVDSTTMVGAHYSNDGVRIFKYNNVYSSGLWDVIEIDLPRSIAVQRAKQSAINRVGYDAVGVALQFIHMPIYKDKSKVWCSEFCAKVINYTAKEAYKLNTRIMPNELYTTMIDKLNGKRIYRPLLSGDDANYKPVIDRFGRVEVMND